MSEYHEPPSQLTDEAKDFHRALTSLKEEIEAVDWYHQRVEGCTDPSLRAILAHNRDEEIEHACMTLEWLRRNMGAWNEQLRTYLFTDQSIVGREHGATEEDTAKPPRLGASGLGLGSLRPEGSA